MSNDTTQHTPADVRERVNGAWATVEAAALAQANVLDSHYGGQPAKAAEIRNAVEQVAAFLRTPRGEGEGKAQLWRKVGEEPPPNGVQVLVYDPRPDGYSDAGCWAYTLIRKGDQFYLDGERRDEEVMSRLHIEEWLWQPLPPYPGSRSKDDDVRDAALRSEAQGEEDVGEVCHLCGDEFDPRKSDTVTGPLGADDGVPRWYRCPRCARAYDAGYQQGQRDPRGDETADPTALRSETAETPRGEGGGMYADLPPIDRVAHQLANIAFEELAREDYPSVRRELVQRFSAALAALRSEAQGDVEALAALVVRIWMRCRMEGPHYRETDEFWDDLERAYQLCVRSDGAQGDAEVLAAEILAELRRARGKFPGNNVTTLALVEEVGELAKATFEESRDRVRREAIQVAVMAMRVVLDGDRTLDAWREAKGLDPLVVAARRGEAPGDGPVGAVCANCGAPNAAIAGGELDPDEAVCSVECYEQLRELGCPQEHGGTYRPKPARRGEGGGDGD